MKSFFASSIFILFLFIQNSFSQKNDNWVQANIFTETDTISGFIKSKSISFTGIKFRNNSNSSSEFLTPKEINSFTINNKDIYEKVFIKAFGNYGKYQFGKLLLSGNFNLYQTAITNYSGKYGSTTKDVFILKFDDKIIKLSLNAFQKLKSKKKIAKELKNYTKLQSIVLKKDFNFYTFFDEIKILNSNKKTF